MAKQKLPKQSSNPYKKKEPKEIEQVDKMGEEKFRWRCNSIDLDGNWGFRSVPCENLWRDVIPRLHDFESMTWNEIMGSRSTSDHTMPVAKIEEAAKKRLLEIDLNQLENLFQLSIAGKPRLWGYKDRIVFHLLWYDPEHTVYIVEKKNT